MRHPLFLGLVVLATLLLAVLVVEIAGSSGPPPGRQPGPRAAVASAGADHAAAPAQRLPTLVATILGRPLFEPSRRPPPAAAAADAAAPGLPRLTGIVMSPAGRSVIFAGPHDGRPLVLTAGDRLGDVMIQSIADDQVVVVDHGGQHVLSPSFEHAPPAAATTATPPPASIASPAAPSSPAPIDLPGLRGRPLGLVAEPVAAVAAPPAFPSLAAPQAGGTAAP